MTVGLFVLGRKPGTASDFVEFWEPLYRYPAENVYTDNVGLPLTANRTRALYEWKNGGKLSDAKRESVERHFIGRLQETKSLPKDVPPEEFLERFSDGGAIWRIYWLHLWQPDRYPIYDQHVHRAMQMIQEDEPREIPSYDPSRISLYLEAFLPFCRARFDGLAPRRVDRALWACGKYLKPFTRRILPACESPEES